MKPSSTTSSRKPSTGAGTASAPTPPAGGRAKARSSARSIDGSGDEVVMVVDVRDPRTGDPVRATTAQGERVDAAVREAHQVVEAHGGRTVALLGTRLIGSFPDGAVEAGLDAAVDLQQRSAAPAASWACSIGLATGPDNHRIDSAGLGIPLVGGAVDRALLLAAWSSAGAVLADDRTIATAQRGVAHVASDPVQHEGGPREGTGARAGAEPDHDAETVAGTDAATAAAVHAEPHARWSLGPSHVLVGHEREPVEYWELSFAVDETSTATCPQPTRTAVRERLDALDPTRPLEKAMPKPARRPDVRITTGPGSTRARAWSRGEVRCWFPNRGRGVIGSSTTQEFYVDRRFLAVPSTIEEGDTVYFVPRDAVGGGRNPAASSVLVVGAEVEVRVDRVDPRGFGVSELRDPAGTRASLVLDLAGSTSALSVEPGDWLLVRIRAAEHGPVGEPV